MTGPQTFPDRLQLEASWPDILDQLADQAGTTRLQRSVKVWLSPKQVRPIHVDESGVLLLDCPNGMHQRFIKEFHQLLPQVASAVLGVTITGLHARVSRESLRHHRDQVRQVDDARNKPASASDSHPALEPLTADAAKLSAHAAGPLADGAKPLADGAKPLADGAKPLADGAKPSRDREDHRADFSPKSSRSKRSRAYKELDDFVVGRCNQLAYHAIQNVLADPAGSANPLFIHGASGLGKTHLEQGLAQAFKARHPKSKVLYTTCEHFRNEYMAAHAKGQDCVQALRVSLRHADLLLIDDIHFFSRSQGEKTKDELFLTLDELNNHGKKVVITSDAHPADIDYLEHPFVQRFIGGLVIRLEQPDLDTRRDVVIAKGRANGVVLADEVAQFIAAHITDNMRELEGAVHKVTSYAKSFRRPIDLELTRQALFDVLARDAREPRQKVVLRSVADYFDITVEDILSRRRGGGMVLARHIAMYVLKYSGNDTYAAVAAMFHAKSHATVMNACQAIAARREEDNDISRFVGDLLLRVQRR